MTDLTLQPILVATTSADEAGRLVLADERLVAVLVRLDDAIHEQHHGRWYLEAGFGPCTGAVPAPFADLDEALAWVAARLASEPMRAPGAPAGSGNGAGWRV